MSPCSTQAIQVVTDYPSFGLGALLPSTQIKNKIIELLALCRATAETRVSSVQECSATGLLHHHQRVATSRHTAWLSQHSHLLRIIKPTIFGPLINAHDCLHLGSRPYRPLPEDYQRVLRLTWLEAPGRVQGTPQNRRSEIILA